MWITGGINKDVKELLYSCEADGIEVDVGMNENKDVFVNEETYKVIVEQLGYEPSNLGINKWIEDHQAIVVNRKEWDKLRKKLFEPIL